MDLRFYLSLFMRRLPYFLLFVAIGTAVGGTLAAVLPPLYEAQARLLVESEQIPDDLAASTVRTQATEQLQIIQQRILTRDVLLEMANRLQIYANPAPNKRMNPDEIVADLRERIIILTTGGAGKRGAVSATIVNVGFSAETATLSSTVVNEVVTMILNENVSLRTAATAQTLEFFEQEVARLDKELAEQGAKILEFKTANQEALPDSLEFRRGQQAAGQERLVQLAREEATLKDRRTRLVTLYETTGQVESGPTEGPQTPEQKQLKALQDELSSLLAVLSPTNPRVKLLEAQIAKLEPVVAAQVVPSDTATAGLSAYEIQLADLDGQLAYIAEERTRIEADMEKLRLSIEATPGNAIALDTLERDYANLRAQYDDAVGNRARAETGDLIEVLSKGQRISVIEQAVPPREPTSPNRPLVMAAGLGGGIAVGLGFILLLELLNRAVRRPADLMAKLGIAPFATLPLMRTHAELRRRRAIILAAFAVALVGIPVAFWAVNTFYMPLDLLLRRALEKLGFAALALPNVSGLA